MKVVVREFGSGNPVLPKHVHWAAKRDGMVQFGLVEHVTVSVQHDDWNHYVEVQLHLSLDEKRYLTKAVTTGISSEVLSFDKRPKDHPVQEISGSLLRTIRVAEIARLGALGAMFITLTRDEPPVSMLQWGGPSPSLAGGEFAQIVREQGPAPHNLQLLALQYQAASFAGEPPAKAVQQYFGLPARTATYWIAKARSEGLLDPLEVEYFQPPRLWLHQHQHPYETRWPDGPPQDSGK